jgi:hypothetical protein
MTVGISSEGRYTDLAWPRVGKKIMKKIEMIIKALSK